MLTTILVCALAALIAGGSGYFISNKFWKSNYSSTNKSGDFGSPRGGVFASAGGMLIGMLFMNLIGQHVFPAETVGPAFLTAMIVGAIGGFIPLIRKGSNKK